MPTTSNYAQSATGGNRQIRVIYNHNDSESSASGSLSYSGGSHSESDNSWERVSEEIGPSESASHSRSNHHHHTQPRSSRRNTIPHAPELPPLREQARRSHTEQYLSSHPRASASRHRPSASAVAPESFHYRGESRHPIPPSSSTSSRDRSVTSRTVSGGSDSSVAQHLDDYPNGHPGLPRQQYPYRTPAVPPPGSAYPPSMTSGGPHYEQPYSQSRDVMDPRGYGEPFGGYQGQRPDPFGRQPNGNPFEPFPEAPQAPPPGIPPYYQQDHFSGGYPPPEHFGGRYHSPEAQEPSRSHSRPPQQRPGMRERPLSYASGNTYQTEPAAMVPYGAMMPYGNMWPHMAGPMGGYPSMPHYGWQPPPQQLPRAPTPSPPKEEKNPQLEKIQEMLAKQLNEATKKEGGKNEEIESLKQALEVVRAEATKQKKEYEAEKAKEAAEKAAAELKAAEEKKKKEEIAEASKKAKEEAEKKAAEAAAKTKEEADKKLAEATKAKEELEKKKKELEETVKKNEPPPDTKLAPIRFKDAVGRKFSFPWAICKTWKGMEGLIVQAFLHVDSIGEHVRDGHYDLTGPDGEIILPQVWDTMVKPDTEITMHLWPLPEDPKKKAAEKPAAPASPPAGAQWPPGFPGMPGGFPGMPGDRRSVPIPPGMNPEHYERMVMMQREALFRQRQREQQEALNKALADAKVGKKSSKHGSSSAERKKHGSPVVEVPLPAGLGVRGAAFPPGVIPPPPGVPGLNSGDLLAGLGRPPGGGGPGGMPPYPMFGGGGGGPFLGGPMPGQPGASGALPKDKKSSGGSSSSGAKKSKSKSGSKSVATGLTGWMLGAPAKSSKKK